MDAISILPSEIAEWLAQRDNLRDIRFITEFIAENKEIPLRRAIVAVGIRNLIIEDSFTENDEGVLIENEYCRLATVDIRLAIHVPFSMGGNKCHEVFTKIIDSLTFGTTLNIISSGCGEVTADRDTDALVLECNVQLTADFCPAVSSGLSFYSFIDKELLCGSHIRNNEIHVTTANKALWNEPYRIGIYSGNGAASRAISLGFKPIAVIVSAVAYPPVTIDFAQQKGNSYMGIATADYSSLGIEISSSGFRLLSSGTYVIGNVKASLNASGETYFYIAYK